MPSNDQQYQEEVHEYYVDKYYLEVEWTSSIGDMYYHTMDTRVPGLGKHFESELIFNLKDEDGQNEFAFRAYLDVSRTLLEKLKKDIRDDIWVESNDLFLKDKTVLLSDLDDNTNAEKQMCIDGELFQLSNLDELRERLINFVTGLLDFLYRSQAIKKVPTIDELNNFADMFIRKIGELEEHNKAVGHSTLISKMI